MSTHSNIKQKYSALESSWIFSSKLPGKVAYEVDAGVDVQVSLLKVVRVFYP
jgi:hypothetical protein